MLSRKFFDKNGVIWCNLGCPKVCYYQPKKKQQFKGKNQEENLIAIFLSQISLDEHVSRKINKFEFKGGLGQKKILKNQTK